MRVKSERDMANIFREYVLHIHRHRETSRKAAVLRRVRGQPKLTLQLPVVGRNAASHSVLPEFPRGQQPGKRYLDGQRVE